VLSGCDNQCGSTKVDAGCGCGQPGPSGCDNQCGSTKVDDACGVCDGDGSSCATPAPTEAAPAPYVPPALPSASTVAEVKNHYKRNDSHLNPAGAALAEVSPTDRDVILDNISAAVKSAADTSTAEARAPVALTSLGKATLEAMVTGTPEQKKEKVNNIRKSIAKELRGQPVKIDAADAGMVSHKPAGSTKTEFELVMVDLPEGDAPIELPVDKTAYIMADKAEFKMGDTTLEVEASGEGANTSVEVKFDEGSASATACTLTFTNDCEYNGRRYFLEFAGSYGMSSDWASCTCASCVRDPATGLSQPACCRTECVPLSCA
jgi:hypothetical protein